MSLRFRDEVARQLRAAGCVFAEDEAELLMARAGSRDELDAMVASRAAGLPLEHVLGWAEFCGMRIAVDPGVFVPRPRTEFLAGLAVLECAPGAVVVDVCCGSGAVGAHIVRTVASVELHAADVDPAAVACARRNLEPFGGRVYEGDLFAALPDGLRGRIDVMTANVPYVPSGEIALLPQEAREFEPRAALDGGADGLAVLRRVLAGVGAWLAPAGVLLVEVSERQAPCARDEFEDAGLAVRVVLSEEWGSAVVLGRAASGGLRPGRDEAGEQT